MSAPIQSGLLIAAGLLMIVGARGFGRGVASFYEGVATKTPRVEKAGLLRPAVNPRVWTILFRIMGAFMIVIGLLTITGVLGFL